MYIPLPATTLSFAETTLGLPAGSFPFASRFLNVGETRFLANCEASLGALTQKPALIVWGDADIAFRSKDRMRFETLLPKHRTVKLRGAGQYIWEDAPEDIVSALRSWCRSGLRELYRGDETWEYFPFAKNDCRRRFLETVADSVQRTRTRYYSHEIKSRIFTAIRLFGKI